MDTSELVDARNRELYLILRAQLRTKTDSDGEHALLKADGQYELDTIAKGDLKGDPSVSFR